MSASWLYLLFVHHHARLRQAIAAGLGALCLSGCMSWQKVHQQPADLLARHPHTTVRVVLHDGGRLLLRQPFIRSDSLGGVTDSTNPSAPPVLVALKDVHHLEIEQVDAGRTFLAVAAIGASTALVVSAAEAIGKLSAPRPAAGSMNIKISCPLVYSWDGHHWRLDSGTFGGAVTEGLQRTDLDNLDYVQAEGGVLRLRVSNELAETDHLDGLAVLAVDHDPSLTVAPDPSGGLHTIGDLVPPFRATDDRGADALPRVVAVDGWNWESTVSGRDPHNPADLRSGLELAFTRPQGATRAHLVVDANSSAWGSYMLEEVIRAHGWPRRPGTTRWTRGPPWPGGSRHGWRARRSWPCRYAPPGPGMTRGCSGRPGPRSSSARSSTSISHGSWATPCWCGSRPRLPSGR